MRQRIVIWSGGYDSTLCLWKELQMYKEATAWSFEWSCIDKIKRESEKVVRNRFKEKIKRKGWNLKHEIIKIEHNIFPYGVSVMQACMFVPMSIYLAPNNSTIIFGFCWKDDFWMYCKQFEDLKQKQSELMSKNVELEYPIANLKKFQVIDEIKYFRLSRCVWTCEQPRKVMKECGRCETCLNKNFALRELKTRIEKKLYFSLKDKRDGEIKESLVKLLKKQ
jgi:7-cyano-7-deazaguanine synthase in queuosine biosynthesis